MAEYNHKEIEPKWQKYWEDNKTFKAEIDKSKEKYYVLDMFPYPSGAGLHVGHAENYTISDIISRYKRMRGFNVLHPMGWDAFGLPAERYAENTGMHPAEVVKINTKIFRDQLKAIGFSYDWDREINTTDPGYYKWTQWILKILFERGLAYEVTVPVNWCPKFGTVLANEEVKDGKYVETGDEVVKKPMRQWMLKITDYAEKLLEGLDRVDWPESIKTMQREWIGKSTGADLTFKVDGKDAEFTVYTTRPDTLFGATYCVLAPEHALVKEITTDEQADAVKAYVEAAAKKSAQDRLAEAKEKTGAFTGAYAINPLNGDKLPIYIADYVLGDYGYGAIMAVPAHDQRDYDFAKKFDLPIIQVIEGGDISKEAWEGDGVLVNSGFLNGLRVKESKAAMIKYAEENGFGKGTVNYKLRDWLFARQRYWGEPFPIIHTDEGIKTVPMKDLPVLLPPMADFKPREDGEPPLAKAADWLETVDPDTGKPATRETNTMPQWAGSSWYFLRFCDPHNDKEAWSKEADNYWMPVDIYVGGVEHAVLHLLYARFWQKVLYDAGLVSCDEPFKRLVNQGMILAYSYRDDNGKYYYPKQVEKRGTDWYVKGSDIKVNTQVEKMSKSRYNVVNPDEVIDEYGADSMRLYEMFMGPIEAEKPWAADGINGVNRFLKRVWNIVETPGKVVTDGGDEALTKLMHKTVKGITEDMERLTYNTAIAKLMEFVNAVYKSDKPVSKTDMEKFVLMLAPMAPHISEELWQRLGHDKTLAFETWPTFDEAMTQDAEMEIVIQVLGKKRASIFVPTNAAKDDILALAKQSENVKNHLDGKQIVKEIYVPGRLVNFVVK